MRPTLSGNENCRCQTTGRHFEKVNGRSSMRRDERIVSASKLRFPVSGGIIMDHIFLGRAIDHSLRLFHCRRFAFGGVGGHKLLYSRLQ